MAGKTPQQSTTVPADAQPQPVADGASPVTAMTVPAAVVVFDPEDYDFGADGEAHRPKFDKSDLANNFFRVAQSNTPQAGKRNVKYIDGLEAGDLFTTAGGTVFSGTNGTTHFIICAHRRSVTEWWPRKEDGTSSAPGGGNGFVADHGENVAILQERGLPRNERNQVLTPEGTQLVEGHVYYGIALTLQPVEIDGRQVLRVVNEEQAALVLSSTQMKIARKLNTLMEGYRDTITKGPRAGQRFAPAPYYVTYKLTTEFQKNAKGEWFGLTVAYGPRVRDLENGMALYFQAQTYAEVVNAGQGPKLNMANQGGEEIVVSADQLEGAPKSDDLPF